MTMQRLAPLHAVKRILLCAAIAAGQLTGSGTASADPGASTPAAERDDANEFMERGFAELKRGDLDAARRAFAASWARRHQVIVALSLAELEMRLDRFADAAEHWQYLTMNLPASATDQRDSARAKLDVCRSHVGSVTVQATPDGSSVVVDDRPAGESPLGREFFLEPGAHSVYATRDGRRSSGRTFQVSAGSHLSFTLAVPVEEEKTAARSEATKPASQLPAPRDVHPQSVTAQHGEVGLRVPVIIGGGVAALAAAGLGTYFVVKRNSASDNAASARRDVEAEGDTGVPKNSLCAGSKRPAACAALAGDLTDVDRFTNLSIGAFIGAGTLVAGTLVTMVLWKGSADSHSAGEKARVTLAPLIGSSSGVQVAGTF